MVEVAGEVARRLHVDNEEHAAIGERLASTPQYEVRCGLVVDGVEGGDEIEARGRQSSDVSYLEPCVAQAELGRLRVANGDGVLGDVEADETRLRERCRHDVEAVSRPATDVGDGDAGIEPLDEPVGGGEIAGDQELVVAEAIEAVDQPCEAGPESRVRHAGAVPEGTSNRLEMRGEEANHLRARGHVPARLPGQAHGVSGRKLESVTVQPDTPAVVIAASHS